MAEWPCCHDPLRFSPISLRFIPPEPLQGHGVAEARMRSGSVPGISGLDSPRLEKEDCWSGHWGGGSWDLVVSTPARAEKTPSALQGASCIPCSHARLMKTGAAADNGSLHADPAAHAAMPRCATRGQPLLACSAAAGGLPSGPGPLRSGLPPAGERLGAAGASPTSLAAAGEMPGFPHSYKKTSCFPHEINPVKSAIFF